MKSSSRYLNAPAALGDPAREIRPAAADLDHGHVFGIVRGAYGFGPLEVPPVPSDFGSCGSPLEAWRWAMMAVNAFIPAT